MVRIRNCFKDNLPRNLTLFSCQRKIWVYISILIVTKIIITRSMKKVVMGLRCIERLTLLVSQDMKRLWMILKSLPWIQRYQNLISYRCQISRSTDTREIKRFLKKNWESWQVFKRGSNLWRIKARPLVIFKSNPNYIQTMNMSTIMAKIITLFSIAPGLRKQIAPTSLSKLKCLRISKSLRNAVLVYPPSKEWSSS